ncbi:MAG: hypothetical protein K9J27_04490 [Bacteroidales bacterium]|nr:hypothetical protein [Bacteroidales bacterium]MCF8333181.1 hypothetical protein [Bacteroidales bacterium]
MKTNIFFLSILMFTVISCEKYRKFDHLEVIDNSFTEDGKSGKWKVKIVFSDFEGDGTFDLNPIQ